jgi:hypothetical protein
MNRIDRSIKANLLPAFLDLYRGCINRRRSCALAQIIIAAAAIISIYSCANPEPAPIYAPAPSAFYRAWSAAINAAQDEGVRIISEDRVSGRISGIRGEQEITIYVRTQADGNVRLEFSVRGPKGADPGLASRISRAYDRRMGR